MKNSLNLVLVILFLVVLGCSCPKMDDITKKSGSTTPSSSPSSTTDNSDDKTSDSKSTSLTMDKYNKVKNGMSYKEVVEIMGSDGTETFNSTIGKYTTVSYKWEGENFQFIYATFQNDKLTSKTQANLK